MQKTFIGLALAGALAAGSAQAALTPEELARLGGDELTPLGAERAGNADGTIPPWTGGLRELPEGYVEGERLVDPFADDEVLFTITAENADQYADKLTPGQLAMFERYPDTFRMPVYPSRRSARYPDSEFQRILDTASDVELVPGGNG
ncbi:MAG TPA: DUF1329 domain-containing protein, partial [Pseudohaliea sp.]|nr:DUF1329 domain-containing protein [Pseudohaliea sp.]